MRLHPPGLDGRTEPPEEGETFDVGVIGLGPAGVTASTELVRYGYDVVAVEKERIGGLIHHARRVDNFPGIPPGSPGVTVVETLWEHLGHFPPMMVEAEVSEVYHTGHGYGISLGETSITVRALVLATGTVPRRLEVPGERLPWVSYSWMDVETGVGSAVAVIGGGDVAVDQALSLHDSGCGVLMMLRSGAPRCNVVLRAEMERSEGLDVMENVQVLRFQDRDGPTVVYTDGRTEGTVSVDAVLVSIGRDPVLPMLNGAPLSLSKAMYLAPEGLFLAGDMVAERRRQVAIAMGSGLEAAMRCDEYFRRVRECD